MKRVKSANGYTIYEATTQRDVDNYGCNIGCCNIYLSSDIRLYGLSNSYPEYQDVDSIAAALNICRASNFAIADALADELSDSTVQDMDLVLAIEARLDAGDPVGFIRQCYDRETGRLYSSISEAIAAGYEPYMDDISALDSDPYDVLDDSAEGFDPDGLLDEGDLEDVFEAAMAEDLNMGSEPDEVDLLCKAMTAAGYDYAPVESYIGWLVFRSDYGDTLHFITWPAVREWLEGVVFDDPEVSDAVERILHPEHFTDPDLTAACDALREYLDDEFGDADPCFDNLSNVGVAYTTTEDEQHELQVSVDLIGHRFLNYVDGVLVGIEDRPSLHDMVDELRCMDFCALISDCTDFGREAGIIIDRDEEDTLVQRMAAEGFLYDSFGSADYDLIFSDADCSMHFGSWAEVREFLDEPETKTPAEPAKPERRSHASYYVVKTDEGDYVTHAITYVLDRPTLEYQRQVLFHEVARRIAFSDCSYDEVVEIVFDGEPCHYTGWQPGMVIEFVSDITGEVVYSDSYPEWDH